MQKKLNLIVASQKDCSELAFFNKSLAEDGGSNNIMTRDELELRMHQLISNGYLAFIFEVENEHIGYALIDNNKNPVFVRQFFVAKQFRRKGYGKMAFNQLVAFLNVDKIDLTVLYSNKVGYEFWKNCGLLPYEISMHYRKERDEYEK
ncbi:hypothetical protein FACS189426_11660 [Bacteroidia bacterium]|nr:hypothetical protein FACS189426_11660 [Bacteroidia bacterium]